MTIFEKECEKNETERNYELEEENVISFLRGSKTATVTFSQGRFISKIYKLAEKFPEDVQIVAENKNKEGNVSSIVAHIPTHYLNISNRKRELSDEERKAIGERLSGWRSDAMPEGEI